MFSESFKGVSRKFQRVSRKFQVSGKFQGCLINVSRGFQGFVKEV